MLLCLAPPAPLPSILFTLTFPSIPDSLPLPPAWQAHLQVLQDTSLAAPPSLYALDAALIWPTLLHTVTFDLSTLTVSCLFIDGSVEEWPLTNRCIALLESVIHNVHLSAIEADRENTPPPRPPSPTLDDPDEPTHPQKPLRPKKRRSFLASLLSTLVPSSPPASVSASVPPSPPPPPPPPPTPLLPSTIPQSRTLRRRARSTLVDAFRRFVLSELAARARACSPSSSSSNTFTYALWVARSTARSAFAELARDDAASCSSDGSSVHTPLDAHDPAPPGYDDDALRAVYVRTRGVVARLVAQAEAQADAGRCEMEVLEVRSRRRAWSGGVCPGRGGKVGGVGLGVPRRSSPLCCVWGVEDVGVGVKEGWMWGASVGVGECARAMERVSVSPRLGWVPEEEEEDEELELNPARRTRLVEVRPPPSFGKRRAVPEHCWHPRIVGEDDEGVQVRVHVGIDV